MNLIVNLNSLEYLYDYLSMGVSNFIVGTELFSCRQALTLDYQELKALKNKDSQIKVFVLVNALVEEHLLADLQRHLAKLQEINIDGLLFQDMAVLQLFKENEYDFKLIYAPDTLNTNYLTLNFLHKQGIDGAFIAREIPLTQKKLIQENVSLKTMVQIHGVEYMAYSKRKLLSNYQEVTGLNFKTDRQENLQIRAKDTNANCHIYEDQYGSHILSCKQLCTLDILNQFMNFDYLYLEGLYTSSVTLLEIVHLYVQAITAIKEGKYNKEAIELMHLLYRLTPQIEYYHSFLFDSTVYKIADVRKRENENDQSNY